MKHKKVLSAILAVIMILTLLPMTVIAETSEDFEYWILDDGTAGIGWYTGTAEVIAIPSKINGYTVTQIGDGTFGNCINLMSIIIPDSIVNIGSEVFHDCINLTSIEIPDSVTSIGDDAFIGCSGLTSIIIPDSVTDIGHSAFTNCSSLTRVKLPENITYIATEMFLGCSSLKSITIPKNVTTVAMVAFAACDSLTDVYYGGTQEEWNNIEIGFDNDALINATIHFNTTDPELPEEPTTEEPTTQEPTTQEPTTQEPTTEEPTTQEPTTQEPTTQEPTTQEPTTQFPTTEPSTTPSEPSTNPSETPTETELLPKEGSDIVLLENNVAQVKAEQSVSDILAQLENENVKIVDKDGKELADDALIGTGAKVQVIGDDGAVLSKYTVLIPMDVSGDGKVNASDARTTLRTSAMLETLDGVFSMAADANGDGIINASDARTILRRSAKLD